LSNARRPIVEALRLWVFRRLDDVARRWLEEQLERVRHATGERPLYAALGFVPAKLGKADLALDADDLARAERCRTGWNPHAWSVDQSARILLVLESNAEAEPFARLLETLFATADVGEAVALYRGLPLYPGPEQYVRRATEGARTSMRSVFEAVAHDNPYPADFFSETAWNHMVVKALFIGSTLAPIQGLERRENAELAIMLRGYAHERWSAGRPVSPEVWRCVGRFGGMAAVEDLSRVLAGDSPLDRRAAALALVANGSEQARAVLQREPALARSAADGTLTWATLYDAPQNENGQPT